MGEKQDAFPFYQKQGKDIHSPHFLKNIVLEMLASKIKKNKKHIDWKGKNESVFFQMTCR